MRQQDHERRLFRFHLLDDAFAEGGDLRLLDPVEHGELIFRVEHERGGRASRGGRLARAALGERGRGQGREHRQGHGGGGFRGGHDRTSLQA